MLDSPDLNARLFFPRRDVSKPPPGAEDFYAGDWHVRRHGGPDRLLLLFHGNGEVIADYDGLAGRFAKSGFRLAVADFPGYGASRGAPTLRRLITEAALVADAVKPDVIMGRSLGSACANALLDRADIVLESGFVDLAALVRRRGFEAEPPFDALFDPLPKLARMTRKLLVIHGADDTLISADEARRAYEAAGTANKRLVLIPGHGHNDVSMAPEYWAALSA